MCASLFPRIDAEADVARIRNRARCERAVARCLD